MEFLSQLAQAPGAWVISGGTHAGVMKHVGDALQESNAACIGIARWGIITDKDKLTPESIECGGTFTYNVGSWLRTEGAYLDSNHTHFLLVDSEIGGEIKLRTALEKHVIEKFKCKLSQ